MPTPPSLGRSQGDRGSAGRSGAPAPDRCVAGLAAVQNSALKPQGRSHTAHGVVTYLQLPENRSAKTEAHCHLYRPVGSKFVSAESLHKTGVSAVLAGDFREILARVVVFRSLETKR